MPVRSTRRDFLALACAGVSTTVSQGCLSAAAAPAGPAVPRLGMNLNGPTDWNSELPFVDVFRICRRWISQRLPGPWGRGPELALDEAGWVTHLEPRCAADALMCTSLGGHYPAGLYTVLYEGVGQLEFSPNVTVRQRRPGRLVIKVDSTRTGFWLRLTATEPSDYVRNIRVVMPGFERSFQSNPFHPAFLHRWQGIACLRFMDWMQTNHVEQLHWEDRPQVTDATFFGQGVALETMIDLSNRLQADPWFCIPHRCDDHYVRQFATMVRDRLDPGLRVYVEYSNEVWNSIFPAHQYAGKEGMKRGFADQLWPAALRYSAYRSAQIFRIWQEVFSGTKRLVRIAPSQAGNPAASRQVLEFQQTHQAADALAIAPYLSCSVPLKGKTLTLDEVSHWSVDQALDYLQQEALPRSIKWMRQQKSIADKYRLLLVAYEAGQHMVGIRGAENDEKLTQLFFAANAHPRMGQIYRQYLQAWTEVGGDLLCHFSSVATWSKHGSWGLMQYYDDDPRQNPKCLATLQWAQECGQPVNLPPSAPPRFKEKS